MAHQRRAFTIVELLVVVAIITLLLAMLAPALSKSIYQAKLAVCAAQQRTTASGLHRYAFDFRRFYPTRQLPSPSDSHQCPVTMLAGDIASQHVSIDIRPQLKGYVQINKQLLDPLVGEVDLEFQDPAHSMTSISTYAMWFGWRYYNRNIPDGLAGMERMGDMWEFAWNPTDALRGYDLLLGDVDLTWNGPTNISSSHPDAGGGGTPKLYLVVQNDLFAPTYGIRTFQSWWGRTINVTGQLAQRALVDMNYTSDDESVRQLNGYKLRDERYQRTQYFFNNERLSDYIVYIPSR